MAIERSDVERIAELARLDLDEPEIDGLTRDLRSILDHFEAIRSLDVDDVPAVGALERAAPVRDDRPGHDPLEAPLTSLAPAWDDGFFVLPRLPALDQAESDRGGTTSGGDGAGDR